MNASLNSPNVRRLLNTIKSEVEQACSGYLFEPTPNSNPEYKKGPLVTDSLSIADDAFAAWDYAGTLTKMEAKSFKDLETLPAGAYLLFIHREHVIDLPGTTDEESSFEFEPAAKHDIVQKGFLGFLVRGNDTRFMIYTDAYTYRLKLQFEGIEVYEMEASLAEIAAAYGASE